MDDLSLYVADLANPRSEGLTKYMYRDSAPAGYLTCGIGVKLDSLAEATEMHWRNYTAGRPADKAEVAAEMARVMNMPTGHAAPWYRNTGGGQAPIVELVDGEAESAARARLEHVFLPALRRVFPQWETFPQPLRRALVDIVWNTGEGRDPAPGDKGKGIRAFTNLRAALNRVPIGYEAAALASHRVEMTPHARARNDWTAAMIRSAAPAV